MVFNLYMFDYVFALYSFHRRCLFSLMLRPAKLLVFANIHVERALRLFIFKLTYRQVAMSRDQ